MERSWGRAYGVCKGCRHETWYFNYFAFQPRGAGVELRAGRVAAIFTLYQPEGWHTNRGLGSATPSRASRSSTARSSAASAAATPSSCCRDARATTAFYVLDNRLWAFGLYRPGLPLCRV